jgi:hypothetical protein
MRRLLTLLGTIAGACLLFGGPIVPAQEKPTTNASGLSLRDLMGPLLPKLIPGGGAIPKDFTVTIKTRQLEISP